MSEIIPVTINGVGYGTELDAHGVQRVIAPGRKQVALTDLNDLRLQLALGHITVDEAIAAHAETEPSMHLIWETYTWEANCDYHAPAMLVNPLWKQVD